MQDRAIAELGRLEMGKAAKLEPYQQYVEEITPGKVSTVGLVMFSKKNARIIYKHVDVTKVNQDNYQKFGYRKGSARGGDITFTTKFGDLDKKLKVLISVQWPSLLTVARMISSEEFEFFEAWWEVFKENHDKIRKDLTTFYAGLDKNHQQTSGFSLAIEMNGETRFLTDFKSIQKQILLNGTEGKKRKYNVVSEGKDNLCSICFKKKPTLYGFASPFKYATVDKPGTVSGYFNQENNWINYPICEDCALHLELGKNYVTKTLSRSFFGRRYYLIPKTILQDDVTRLQKALKLIEKINYESEKSDQIESREDYLMERLGGIDNLVSLNLLFHEENPTTKAIKIKLMLEEIPPSRFRTLFVDTPKVVNQHTLYVDADYSFKSKERKDLRFSIGLIKHFFNENFYETIYKIFAGHSLKRSEVFLRFMEVIRDNYNKQMNSGAFAENRLLTVLKAHLALRYFQNLNVVSIPNITLMIPETEEEKQDLQKKTAFDIGKLRTFINNNGEFFYGNEVAGIFALGVLVSLVLTLQQRSLKSTPFERKLKGLNLSAADLQKIFTESVSKINQYTSPYAYKELRELILETLIAGMGKIAGICNQEVSFYFVAGMDLGSKFRSEKESIVQE